MNIDGQKIKFVNNVVYLGVSISSNLCGDTDIARQARYLYCAANKLKTRFFLMFNLGEKHFILCTLHVPLCQSTSGAETGGGQGGHYCSLHFSTIVTKQTLANLKVRLSNAE